MKLDVLKKNLRRLVFFHLGVDRRAFSLDSASLQFVSYCRAAESTLFARTASN